MDRWFDAGPHARDRHERDLARAAEHRLARAAQPPDRPSRLESLVARFRSPRPAQQPQPRPAAAPSRPAPQNS